MRVYSKTIEGNAFLVIGNKVLPMWRIAYVELEAPYLYKNTLIIHMDDPNLDAHYSDEQADAVRSFFT